MSNQFYHSKKFLTPLARKNRKLMTKAEKLMWNMILSKKKTGFKFTKQKPLGPYILDFYCSQILLAIEIDGESHLEKADYDEQRNNYLKSLGLKVIHYTDEQVKLQLKYVYVDLMQKLELRKKEVWSKI